MVRHLCRILVLASFFGICFSTRDLQEPRILPIQCNNTVQGPHLLADSRGYVCSIRSIDIDRGCCPQEGQQFSCSGCNLTSQCCNTFEYCVSCCLDPLHTSQELALGSKPARQLTAVNYASTFDYCRGRCRHSSASVVHENAYTTQNHHCFFFQQAQHGKKPKVYEEELVQVSLVVGRQGQSCDAACRERRLTCKSSRLQSLNKCSVLQKHFKCQGACISSSSSGLPAEVTRTAPRHLHPGACLFNAQSSSLSCQGAHSYTRRLCPCT